MGNILVTGFEPFDGAKTNASWEAVKLLPDELMGWKIEKHLIPVVFELATRKTLDIADKIGAKVVLCVGLAEKRKEITPERIAKNIRDARIPDNAGNMPKDEPVVPGGPEELYARIPVQKMEERLDELKIPVSVSDNAGTFVCNDLFYGLLQHFQGTEVYAGFIHVPLESIIDPATCERALEECLGIILKNYLIKR